MTLKFKLFGCVNVNVLALIGFLPLLMLNGIECMAIMAFCALCHELAHICAIKYGGGKIKRVDIGFLGAEIIYSGEKMTFASELINSFSGIVLNALLAFGSFMIYETYHDVRILLFCVCNASLSLVNLLPINRFDGSNALYNVLQLKYDANMAYEICRRVSGITSALLVAALLFITVKTGVNTSLAMLFMLAAAIN